IVNFSLLNGLVPDDFIVTVDSTGNLRNCIQNAASCTKGQFDLFLAADTTTPAAVSSFGMVFNGTMQAPFFYATGSLELYAPTAAGTPYAFVNSGLPAGATALSLPLVIASPGAAPYGFAGMTVINTYGYTALGTLTTTSSYPVANLVYTAANIGLTFQNILGG